MILDVFHSQTDPKALCLLVKQTPESFLVDGLQAFVKTWLQPYKVCISCSYHGIDILIPLASWYGVYANYVDTLTLYHTSKNLSWPRWLSQMGVQLVIRRSQFRFLWVRQHSLQRLIMKYFLRLFSAFR